MTAAVAARYDRRHQIPAGVHQDGTSRVQAVHRSEAEDVWLLLTAFGEETGLRVLRFPKEREFFIGFRVAA